MIIDATTINGNPQTASTTYIVQDTGTAPTKYLQVDGTWSTTTATLTYAQLGAGSATTTVGVTSNTLHIISLAAINGAGSTTTFGSALSSYTLAATPNAPASVTSTATGTLTMIIDATTINGNPSTASTTFSVRDTGTGTTKYLQVGGTWSTSYASLTYAQLGSGSPTTTYGVTSNTLHIITISAVNGDGVSTAYGSALSSYTLATTPNAPSSVTSTATGTLSLIIDATAINNNPSTASTTFTVRDTGTGTTKYLQIGGTWSTSIASLTYAQLGSGSVTTTTGVTTNTRHIISLLATNGDGVSTAYGSTAGSYTLAAVPNAPNTVTSTATNTLAITIDATTLNGNPSTASTTFVVRDSATTTSYYLQANGTWSTATTALTYAELGSGSATTTIGLTANSLHTISVKAINGDSVSTVYGSTLNSYTRASTPSNLVANADSTKQITITWTGDATAYYLEDLNEGTNTGWITNPTYVAQGLACGSTHQYRLRGRNGDGVETATISSQPITVTNGCSNGASGGSGSSGGSSGVLSQPISQTVPQPVVAVVVPAPLVEMVGTPIIKSLIVGESLSFVVDGGLDHSVTLLQSSNESITVTIRSTPVTVKLILNQAQDLDTDADGKVDLRAVYTGMKDGKVQISFTKLKVTSVVTSTSTVVVKIPTTTLVNSIPTVVSAGDKAAVKIDLLVPARLESKIMFKILPKTTQIELGKNVVYKVGYKNPSTKSERVQLVRQLIDSKGKVVSSAKVVRIIRAGATTELGVTQGISTKLVSGRYTAKVVVLDAKGKKIDENSFSFEVIKKPLPPKVIKKTQAPIVKKTTKK